MGSVSRNGRRIEKVMRQIRERNSAIAYALPNISASCRRNVAAMCSPIGYVTKCTFCKLMIGFIFPPGRALPGSLKALRSGSSARALENTGRNG